MPIPNKIPVVNLKKFVLSLLAKNQEKMFQLRTQIVRCTQYEFQYT